MSIFEFHAIGGMPWMVFLTLLLLAILGLTGFAYLKKETIHPKWIEAIKQLGGFALAFGSFSTLVAFYQAFSDLASMTETLPFNVIMGGLKVALITSLYGFGIFLISQVGLFVIKLTRKA